jgi:hypothetical protein
MGTVTYQAQPGIHATRGTVPLAGTSHVYKVSRVLWPEAVNDYIQSLLQPPTLHVCSGLSKLGDVRLDLYVPTADIQCDAADMHAVAADNSYATVLCDPPYNGSFRWNHDLLSELARVAYERIVFQHWFIPATKYGLYKKAQEKFALTDVVLWMPRTYFGRVQVISTFDRRQ